MKVSAVLRPVIIIPARMASTRLPGKPLLDMKGKPMIVRVAEQALTAGFDDVYVAAGDKIIVETCARYGIKAVMTDPDLASGSDRVYAAVQELDPLEKKWDVVINLQGDLPQIESASLKAVFKILQNAECDIGTLVSKIQNEAEYDDPHAVKAFIDTEAGQGSAQAYDFSRRVIGNDREKNFHHIGVYAYRRSALQKFIALPCSLREKSEKLEQLRALDNNMTIRASIVDQIPIGVDTQDDFNHVAQLIENA